MTKKMIRITPSIALNDNEIEESFIRASGPGGQNVNKVASAVQLRFDARHSPSLPKEVRVRLTRMAGKRLTKDGVIVITAQRHRSQDHNRKDALDRLIDLIARAAIRPTLRKATTPTRASRRKRLAVKKHRGGIKRLRQGRPELE
jgi:ribosome-associated protein